MKIYVKIEGELYQFNKNNCIKFLKDQIKQIKNRGYADYDPRPYNSVYLGNITSIQDHWTERDLEFEISLIRNR